jgi:fumarylacetoacetate (FAA) hydrolase
MKFATLKTNTPDGQLVLVNRNLTHMLVLNGLNNTVNIPNLQYLLDNWGTHISKITKLHEKINSNDINEELNIFDNNIIGYDAKKLTSPLPRAYQWLDGSAYLHHVELVRKARKAEMPESLYHDPLMYQGCADSSLAPTANITFPTDTYGIDFEAEVSVITDYVPMGTTVHDAPKYIRLVMLVNDVSLRNLIPDELAKGFGFVVSKPASSFSPIAATIDELSTAWDHEKCQLNLPLYSYLNGTLFGKPNAGIDLQFNFAQLIAHAAKTRNLAAGTIIGSGTVSNRDPSVGSSCLAEKRMLEIIATGKAETPFMRHGDSIRIEMLNQDGNNIFGTIEQKVVIGS